VDADGNFTGEAAFADLNVLGDGNQAVIQALQKLGFVEGGTLRPQVSLARLATIYRATEQWLFLWRDLGKKRSGDRIR